MLVCSQAEKMLASERKRVDAYLNAVSLEPLTSECYTHILKVSPDLGSRSFG